MTKYRELSILTITFFAMGTACTPAVEDVARPQPVRAKARSHGFHPPEMVRIEAGQFLMGSPIEDSKSVEYHEDERPQRPVEVKTFYLSRFIVTAEEYCLFLNERGNSRYGQFDAIRDTIEMRDGMFVPALHVERSPATSITWEGAMAYCEWLSQKTGRRFRLPTEAEWEYAARGEELRSWPWGNEEPDPRAPNGPSAEAPFYDQYGMSWIRKPYDGTRAYLRVAVGSFQKNRTPDGIYDMIAYRPGQWCLDEYTWPEGSQERADGKWRVVRGRSAQKTNLSYLWPRRGPFERAWNLMGETGLPQEHAGRSWSRYAGIQSDDRGSIGFALVRLAADADIEK